MERGGGAVSTMMTWSPVLLALLSGGAADQEEEVGRVAARVEHPSALAGTVHGQMGQTVSGGGGGQPNLVFTDLRLTVSLLGDVGGGLGFEGDVRARVGERGVSPRRYDVSRLYLRYGRPERLAVDLGRMAVTELAGAQVDGARLTFGVADQVSLSVFGGLLPHPIERSVGTDFVGWGVGYSVRSASANHAGGIMGQLYRGRIDRIFVVERFVFQLGPAWTWFGLATIDLVGASGLLGELEDKPSDEQAALERVDLTHGFMQVRFRPSGFFDLSANASHVHTLLPRTWWQDWVESERVRLGFAVDGPQPVGTRRTTGRAVANVHWGMANPYLEGRYDVRHEDGKTGFGGRAGFKLNPLSFGYVDLFGEYRRQFESDQKLAGLRMGAFFIEGLSIDLTATVLNNRPAEDGSEARWLGEGSGALTWGLETLAPELSGISVVALYQVFIETDIVQHFAFAQLGYRLSL